MGGDGPTTFDRVAEFGDGWMPILRPGRNPVDKIPALRGSGARVARCDLALGRLARRLGKADRARRHFDTAVPPLKSMQMRYWLDRLLIERVSPT